MKQWKSFLIYFKAFSLNAVFQDLDLLASSALALSYLRLYSTLNYKYITRINTPALLISAENGELKLQLTKPTPLDFH